MVGPNGSDDPEPPRQLATLAALEDMFDHEQQAAAGGPQAFLLTLAGPNPGRMYVISKPEQIIGRSKRAEIRIDEKAVSHEHAKIVRGVASHRLCDLGSTNGTFVNDEPVSEVELRSGDLIRVGQTVMTYLAGGDAEARERTITLARSGAVLPAPLLPGTVTTQSARIRSLDPVPPSADEGMNPREMVAKLMLAWGFVKKNRYWLIGLPIVFGALGAVSLRVAPPLQSALFTVTFTPDPVRNPVENQWERGENRPFEFFKNPDRSFLSKELVGETLEATGQDAGEDSVKNALKRLEFKSIMPHTWQGVYVDSDGDRAERFLKQHVQSFLQVEIDKTLKVIRAEVEFLTNQIKSLESQLKQSERELREFKEKHLAGMPEQVQEQFGSLIDLKNRRLAVESELERVRSELRLSREKLASSDPKHAERVAATDPYQTAISEVRLKLSEARANGLGDLHPQVQELKKRERELTELTERTVASGSSVIDHRASTTYIQLQDRVKSLQAQEQVAAKELSRISGEIAQINHVVEKLPGVEARHAELSRNYAATKEHYERLYQQLNKSKLQLDLERATAEGHYDILAGPQLEQIPMAKVIGKRIGIAMVVGLVLAVLIGLARELRAFIKKYA